MKKKGLIATGILTSSLVSLAWAAAPTTSTQQAGAGQPSTQDLRYQRLQNQINQLKLIVALQQKQEVLKSKQDELKEKVKRATGIGTRGFLNDRIIFSGGVMGQLAMSNYSDSSSFTGGNGRSIDLNTAYLTIHGIVNQNLSALLMISTEPGQTNVTGGEGGVQFEEAYMNYMRAFSKRSRFNFELGRTYMPFGIYKIHPVVSSLAQSLDETNREAAIFGYSYGPLFASAYAFSGLGDLTKNSNTLANKLNGGARIGSIVKRKKWGYDVDLDYINNMAEARDINALMPSTYSRVPNVAFHAMGSLGTFDLSYNYSKPINAFNRTDMQFDGKNAKPEAQEIGASFAHKLLGHVGTISASYQISKEALALNLPKNRMALSYDYELSPYLSCTLEGLRSKDYSKSSTWQRKRGGALTAVANGTGRTNLTGIFEVDMHF